MDKEKLSTESKNGQENEEVELTTQQKFLFKTENFLDDLDVAREMFEVVEPFLAERDEKHREKVDKMVKNFSSTIDDENDENQEIAIPFQQIQNFRKAVVRINKAVSMFKQHSLVLLISKLDEFVTELLRIALGEQPEKLKGSEKSIHYDQIFKYDNINDMIKDIVGSEIDSIMRKSHATSISFLDESFKLGIKSKISSWPDFIEISQRRNLFVHTGGSVTNQYIETCEEADKNIDEEIEKGTILRVDHDYFKKSFALLYELGIRLSQALYRRLYPNNLDAADTMLNQVGFDLMLEERWDLAKIVFDFAGQMPNKFYTSEIDKLRFIINLAICHKRLGNDQEVNDLLNAVDWDAYKSNLRLAVSILRDDYEKASELMKLTPEKEFDAQAYRTWPLFEKFRESAEFKRTYKEKFGEDFNSDFTEDDLLLKSNEEE